MLLAIIALVGALDSGYYENRFGYYENRFHFSWLACHFCCHALGYEHSLVPYGFSHVVACETLDAPLDKPNMGLSAKHVQRYAQCELVGD